MKLEGLIFDFDGTLVDTVSVFMGAYEHALRSQGIINIEIEQLTASLGPNEEGVLRRLAPNAWEKCLLEFYKYEKAHSDLVVVFDGIRDLLTSLSIRGVRLALVTGRGKFHADYFLSKCRLREYFDVVRYGDDQSDIKADNIRFVMEYWGGGEDSVAYVGDTKSDVLAAIQAGVTPILASWSSFKSQQSISNGAVLEFSRVDDLSEWLGSKK